MLVRNMDAFKKIYIWRGIFLENLEIIKVLFFSGYKCTKTGKASELSLLWKILSQAS